MTCHKLRLLTLDEIYTSRGKRNISEQMEGLLRDYGGQFITSEPQYKPTLLGIPFVTFHHAGYHWPLEFVAHAPAHEFVDNGCQRSWCRVCDADGVWDRATGKYVAK